MATIKSRGERTIVWAYERYVTPEKFTARMAGRGFNLVEHIPGGRMVFDGPPVVLREEYLEAVTTGGRHHHSGSWGMLKLLAQSADQGVYLGGSPYARAARELRTFPDMPGRFLDHPYGQSRLSNVMIASTLPPSAEWGQQHAGDIPYFTQKMADDWSRAAEVVLRLSPAL